jgi:hypothetical protein
MNFLQSPQKFRRKVFTFASRTGKCFVCVTIVRRYGTAERTFLPWADGMKDIHPGKKGKRMDARAEIGDFGLIFAHTHTHTHTSNSAPKRAFFQSRRTFPRFPLPAFRLCLLCSRKLGLFVISKPDLSTGGRQRAVPSQSTRNTAKQTGSSAFRGVSISHRRAVT